MSRMEEKPEGELKWIWVLPLGLFLYMVLVAVIGYFVFLA
jgi:hypothetical protein